MENENILRIERINQIIKEINLKWAGGINSISILSDEEKRRLCGLLPLTKKLREKYRPIRIKKFGLPSSLDWRNYNGKNWMTPIKRQGGKDCWAHASCSSMEAKIKIMKNNPDLDIDLSKQQLISCCDECGNYSDGGYFAPSFQYAIDPGIVDERCFPYMWSEGSCSFCPDWENRVNKINSFLNISNEDLKEALTLYGPIAIRMEVRPDFFDYVGGIYEPTSSSITGYHGVVLLGYNDEEEYWILKNSWGTGWGEEGWFRMSYPAGVELFMGMNVVEGSGIIPQQATLTIDTIPIKGEIFVNGISWGIAPQTKEVDAGTYIINFADIADYSTPITIIINLSEGEIKQIIGEYKISKPILLIPLLLTGISLLTLLNILLLIKKFK